MHYIPGPSTGPGKVPFYKKVPFLVLVQEFLCNRDILPDWGLGLFACFYFASSAAVLV